MRLSIHISLGLLMLAARSSLAARNRTTIQNRESSLKFDYLGPQKVRGVNIGGWLVTEPWITPSIYAEWPSGEPVRDEFTFCQTLGKDEALRRLTVHWDAFITAADFAQIAAAGMNHVRIPIGYWSIVPIPGDPYVQGAYERLRRSLDWAHQAGLKVMIDVHGAPGSQNGFDNSGRRGPIEWMNPPSTVDVSVAVIRRLADELARHPAVSSIELLNEPMGPAFDRGRLEKFYQDGRNILEGTGVATGISDAFFGVSSWTGFGNDRPGFLIDTHHYQVFGPPIAGLNDQLASACGFGGQMRLGGPKPVICGEWSAALTDCAKWLNGLGRGARWDGSFGGHVPAGSCAGKSSNSVANLSQQDKQNLRRYIEAQLDSYEVGAGWMFWTWKTEGAPEWDMRDLLSQGVFPQPFTDRQFGRTCG